MDYDLSDMGCLGGNTDFLHYCHSRERGNPVSRAGGDRAGHDSVVCTGIYIAAPNAGRRSRNVKNNSWFLVPVDDPCSYFISTNTP